MKGFKSGIFWGLLFGSVAGLMNAKQSGRETREDIKDFISQTTDDVNDVRYKVDNLKVALQKLNQESKQSIQIVNEDIQTTLKEFSEANEPRIRRVQEKAQKLQAISDTLK